MDKVFKDLHNKQHLNTKYTKDTKIITTIMNTKNTKDTNTIMNTKKGEMIKIRNDKFFKEYPGKPHLDARYGKPDITDRECVDTLIYLLKVFMSHCDKSNIHPILMYGGLIGHWFNKKMLPWDDDLDMILIHDDIDKLKNCDEFDYLIEVNPNSINYSRMDIHNYISARCTSKKNGVFIDILYFKEDNGKFVCKDGNVFDVNMIFPTKREIFHEIEINVPRNIEKCLSVYYTNDVFSDYHVDKRNNLINYIWKFNKDTMDWILVGTRMANGK